MLMEKLAKLYRLDDYKCDSFAKYVAYRIQEYDSEQDIFDSFDKYIDYCISMFKDAL